MKMWRTAHLTRYSIIRGNFSSEFYDRNLPRKDEPEETQRTTTKDKQSKLTYIIKLGVYAYVACI
jgi:hypothetical protein